VHRARLVFGDKATDGVRTVGLSGRAGWCRDGCDGDAVTQRPIARDSRRTCIYTGVLAATPRNGVKLAPSRDLSPINH